VTHIYYVVVQITILLICIHFCNFRGKDVVGCSLHGRRLSAHRPRDSFARITRRARQVGVGKANRQFGRRGGDHCATHPHLRIEKGSTCLALSVAMAPHMCAMFFNDSELCNFENL
jgi:hypothetical protein